MVTKYSYNSSNFPKGGNILKFELSKESKVLISIEVKKLRFNRELDETNFPFTLILVKFGKNRNIIDFLASRHCFNGNDIALFENLKKGEYYVWFYCPAEYVRGDPDMKFNFRVSTKKRI